MPDLRRIEIELRVPWMMILFAMSLLLSGVGYLVTLVDFGSGFVVVNLAIRCVLGVVALWVLLRVTSGYLRHPAFRVLMDETALTVPSWRRGEPIATIPWADIVDLRDEPPRLVVVTASRRHYLHRTWFKTPWSLARVRAEIENRRAPR